MRFEGKVVLVSGGNSGIGAATAVRFAQEGASVMVAARNAETAQTTLDTITASGGSAAFVPCDVREVSQCENAVAETVARFGRLDVLVNNAGIILRNSTVRDTAVEDWLDVFNVNIHGAFYLSKAALPHLVETKGCIVNVSSYAGMVGFPAAAAYCAAKGALNQLTRAMALDHSREGVRVNAVCPGSVLTPMIEVAWERYGEGAPEKWADKHPIGRVATPDEVAGAITYLASDDASFVTGAILPVDGGLTAGLVTQAPA